MPHATPSADVRPTRRAPWAALAVLLAVTGCHGPPARDRASVSHAVEARFGMPTATADDLLVPPDLADGVPLEEDRAVLLALWNNALFRESLVELDLTRADLVTAGLLPNPEFVYYWAEPNKPFKYLIDFPIEALWLRPIRLKAAAAENERAAGKVSQLALDLIRDTRLAYAALQLAADRVAVGERAVAVRERVLELAEARLKAGDASPLEVSTARIDAYLSAQALAGIRHELDVAQEQVRNLTGLSAFAFLIRPDNTLFDPRTDVPVDALVAEAVRDRPDAQAAARAAQAAAERVRVSRLVWVRFLGILDATSGAVTRHEFGPALRMTVPICNWNQGAVARAKAEFEQLERRRQTTHNQIVLDVRMSFARYEQVRAELDFLQKKTRPEVEAAIRRAEAAYKEGNVTYLIVLEMNRQLIDTYLREAQLYADLRRAWAELERGVGRRLTGERVP